MADGVPLIDDYMARDLITLSPGDDIHAAMRLLIDGRISGAPVLDAGGHLVGMLSKKDCLKVVFQSSYHQDWGGRVEEFMSAQVETMASGMSVIEAAEHFAKSPFRRFPVMHEGRLVGQISRHDILAAMEALWD